MSPPRTVDYYGILAVQSTATTQTIRESYRRMAIVEHPDRSQAPDATRRFQYVNDAFVILSDKTKRRQYDQERQLAASLYNPLLDGEEEAPKQKYTPKSNASNVFGSEFEDLLRPEIDHGGWMWSAVGTFAGGGLGFIVFNIPGAVAGAAIGRWIGSIRDAHGKAVLSVFLDLPLHQRAAILQAIAKKIFDTGMGSFTK